MKRIAICDPSNILDWRRDSLYSFVIFNLMFHLHPYRVSENVKKSNSIAMLLRLV